MKIQPITNEDIPITHAIAVMIRFIFLVIIYPMIIIEVLFWKVLYTLYDLFLTMMYSFRYAIRSLFK